MLITSDKISVRKNVLSPEELEPIQEVMLSEEFPWFINNDNPHKFTHIFWKKMKHETETLKSIFFKKT